MYGGWSKSSFQTDIMNPYVYAWRMVLRNKNQSLSKSRFQTDRMYPYINVS
jgi:hypothetical protein